MTGLVVICVISVLALALGGTVLERRVNALEQEIDKLKRQLRAGAKAKEN